MLRSASARRASASRVRAFAAPASVLVTTAATRKTASASQFSPSATVKRPVGGMWNQFQASALPTAVSKPRPSPQRLDTSSTASR